MLPYGVKLSILEDYHYSAFNGFNFQYVSY
jgi:hypothetical protein